jgi:DNA primase
LAGPFPQGFLDAVRGASDIGQMISEFVPLKPSGARLKGLCPFHQEKTPSFSVDRERQLFYCFGCQTGGDIFKFVTLYEKVSFPEAVEMIARRAGVPLPRAEHSAAAGPLDRLLRSNEAAASFFRATLTAAAGKEARAYLGRRGVTDETAARLGLGYATAGWDGLRSHLQSRRLAIDDALAAGLLMRRATGGEYDRFRNRLIFPIRDVQGRTVAFGGRALGDEEPKYMNSPETPLYRKGEHLYGLDLAKEAIRGEGFAVVVEGYLDLAAVLHAGIGNVVASLGTAFTEAQARLLARYTGRVVFSYDGDAAGGSATARTLDLLLAKGFDVRVVCLPAGCDPDDTIRRDGADAYRALVQNAPGYLEFLVQREAQSRDLRKPDEQVAGVQAVLPHLAKLASPVERAHWAAQLADALRIDDEWVLQELRAAVRGSRERIRARPEADRPLGEAEARLVTQLLRGGTRPEVDFEDLAGTRVLPLVRAIVECAAAAGDVSYTSVLDVLDDEEDRALLTSLAFREDPEPGPTAEDCLESLRRRRLSREGREVRRAIGEMQRVATLAPDDVEQKLRHLEQLVRQRDALT